MLCVTDIVISDIVARAEPAVPVHGSKLIRNVTFRFNLRYKITENSFGEIALILELKQHCVPRDGKFVLRIRARFPLPGSCDGQQTI